MVLRNFSRQRRPCRDALVPVVAELSATILFGSPIDATAGHRAHSSRLFSPRQGD